MTNKFPVSLAWTDSHLHIATFPIALLLTLRMRIRLLSLLRKLLISSRQPWITGFRLLRRFIERLLSNPQIAELWRFIFLGTVVETGRIIGQKAVEAISSCMVIFLLSHQILNYLFPVFVVRVISDIRVWSLMLFRQLLPSLPMTSLMIGLKRTWKVITYGIRAVPSTWLLKTQLSFLIHPLSWALSMVIRILFTNPRIRLLSFSGGMGTGYPSWVQRSQCLSPGPLSRCQNGNFNNIPYFWFH
jgi:hypothetical protein